MQVDTERFEWATYYLCAVLFMPVQISNYMYSFVVVSLYLMYYYIGIAFFAGVATICVTSLFNFINGKIMWVFYDRMMKTKDLRTKAVTEMFTAIKFIKINALEEYFIERVTKLRNLEMLQNLKTNMVYCVSVFSVWMAPMMVINATFAYYIYLGNEMNPASTFTIISLFQVLQEPLRQLP